MFTLTLHARFAASHALVFRGVLEPLHWHDWRVEVEVGGPGLDSDGVVADFHALETEIGAVLGPLQNANLNQVPPFGASQVGGGSKGAVPDLNPSAEHVCRHIGESLRARLETRGSHGPKTSGGTGPSAPARGSGSVRVLRVSLSEAPGCVATYRVPEASSGESA